MAQRLTIPLIRHPDHMTGDWFQVEVDAALQSDQARPWGPVRDHMGYGFGVEVNSGYGWGDSFAYGVGMHGFGHYGQGAQGFDHDTRQAFVSADYAVRMRATDIVGNVGDWSGVETIVHRPSPPAPTGLTITGGNLNWSWSDPQ
jgi:hypothetical protein